MMGGIGFVGLPGIPGMMNGGGEHLDTIPAHYGVSSKEYAALVRDIFIELVKKQARTSVLDKFFKELDSNERAKVYAFAHALNMHWQCKEKARLPLSEEESEVTRP